MRRPTVWLLFGAIFVAELGWAGISPLLPAYQDRFSLSDAATGLVLSIAAAGILLVSLPVSALSSAVAVRTLTLFAMCALTVGNLVVGFADSYGTLLAGRGIVGVGLGTMWVAATAWLHDAAGTDSSKALAMTTAVVGIGSLAGPAVAGYLGERFTIGTPFVALGGLCALTFFALLLAPGAQGRVPEPSPPFVEMFHAARADALMITSLLLTLVVAMMWMTTELLAPLRLDALGYSATAIGVIFSGSSILFAVSSALTARRADRYSTIRFSAAWTGAFAAGLLIAVFWSSAPATIVFLFVMGVTSGVMVALTYPLGASGARAGGFNVAVVGALLNIVWALSGIVGPSIGGSVAEGGNDGVVFAALAVIGAVTAAWMWRRSEPRLGTQEPSVPARVPSPHRDDI
jgi:predicted MFS family arabinose efflux permease